MLRLSRGTWCLCHRHMGRYALLGATQGCQWGRNRSHNGSQYASDAPHMVLHDRFISLMDGCCIEMLRPRCRHVEARAACATGIWVDIHCWEHLQDVSGGETGRVMGLKRSLTRRIWCSRIVAGMKHNWGGALKCCEDAST